MSATTGRCRGIAGRIARWIAGAPGWPFHLLPGVDDGPRTLEESLELARAVVADETRTLVATPHVHPAHITDLSLIADAVHELRAALARERIPLNVLAGGELSQSMAGRWRSSRDRLLAAPPTG